MTKQWAVCGLIIVILDDGIWWRSKRKNWAGYWITWSVQKRFGERFEYEKAIWQIGKGKWFRIACFRL